MQKRTILKIENLIVQYKKEYLSYKRLLKRRVLKHDHCIAPVEYKKGVKIIYPVDDIGISLIIGYALDIKNYKLALKNLKWVYLNTTPFKQPCCSNIEAAFVWYKNKKLSEAENILQFVFSQEPRYKNIFNNEPLKGTSKEDGGFSFLNHIEANISSERRGLLNPEYLGFVEWVQDVFYSNQVA